MTDAIPIIEELPNGWSHHFSAETSHSYQNFEEDRDPSMLTVYVVEDGADQFNVFFEHTDTPQPVELVRCDGIDEAQETAVRLMRDAEVLIDESVSGD